MQLIGSQVGNIRITEFLGEGGMGAVYAGFDEKLQRRVAIKSIQRRLRRDEHAKSRFLREARVLSQLAQKNICLIHDFIEDESGDYLVLEYIQGKTLKDIRDAGKPAHADCLAIAVQMTEAMVAAHDKGVVHRDFKPANVMVDDCGNVKVLDFGLACAADDVSASQRSSSGDPQDASEDQITEYLKTQDGTIIGTLGYMSPEQARSEPVTAASDMYSLGLVLQELFTGEASRDEGDSPSIRLLKAGRGQTRDVEGLGADLTKLIERLKSLSPGSRPSAPDTLTQLHWIMGKSTRRLKKIAVAALFTLLTGLSAIMALQRMRIAQEAQRANAQAERANREAEAAGQVADFLVDLFRSSDPRRGSGGETTALELLQTGVDRIRSDLHQQPLIQARLLHAIGRVKLNLGLFDEALDHFSEALALRRDHAEPYSPEIVESLVGLSDANVAMGAFGMAEEQVWQALDIRLSPRLDASDRDVLATLVAQKEHTDQHAVDLLHLVPEDSGPVVKNLLTKLGTVAYRQGELKTAGLLFEHCVGMTEALSGAEDLSYARALNNLAAIRRRQNRLGESEQLYLRAIAIKDRLLGPDHYDLANTLNNLAIVYSSQERYQEAEPMYLRSLGIKAKIWGEDHPKVASSKYNLAMNYFLQEKHEDAEPLFREDLRVSLQTRDRTHPYVIEGQKNLAAACFELGNRGEAVLLWGQALDSVRTRYHRDPSPAICNLYGELAVDYADRVASDDGPTAQSLWLEVVDLLKPQIESTDDSDLRGYYAKCMLHLGRADEVQVMARKLVRQGWGGSAFADLCQQAGLVFE